MSPSNDDKKAQFEALTRKRQEMLDAEKKKRAEREASAAEVSKRQQKESQAESIAAKEHSAKREEWRQEKHDKQREDIEKKYKENSKEKKTFCCHDEKKLNRRNWPNGSLLEFYLEMKTHRPRKLH